MAHIAFSIEKNGDNFSLKLQGDIWELNIHGSNSEINLLRDLPKTNWTDRKTIKLGKSANSNTFWTLETNDVVIMIGHDDETWDFAVSIPLNIVNEIITNCIQMKIIK
jgi:hypothetical protein